LNDFSQVVHFLWSHNVWAWCDSLTFIIHYIGHVAQIGVIRIIFHGGLGLKCLERGI